MRKIKIITALAAVLILSVCCFAAPESMGTLNSASEQTDGTGTLALPEDGVKSEYFIKALTRLHLLYKAEAMTFDEDSSYDIYLAYCKQQGIIDEDDSRFDASYRPILRSEAAQLVVNTFEKDFFPETTSIDSIPDVWQGEEYFEDVLTLYRAGVVCGTGDGGYFCPNHVLTHSQMSLLFDRLAVMDSRLSKELSSLPQMKEAYYLIHDNKTTSTPRGTTSIGTSWNYENRCNYGINSTGATTSTLYDKYTTGYVAMNRTVKTQGSGILTFETKIKITDGIDGARIYFQNTDGKNIFELYTDNGVWNIASAEVINTGKTASTGDTNIKAVFDLDEKSGVFSLNGVFVTAFDLPEDFKNFSVINFSTSTEDELTLAPVTCYLYTNYHINESFFAYNIPYDWTVSGGKMSYNNDDNCGNYSLLLDTDAKAVKSFDEVSGKLVFESYFVMPQATDSLDISLGSIKVNIKDGYIKSGDVNHDFKNHIWQCVHIEADTSEKTYELHINGKYRGGGSFTDDSFDSVIFEYTNTVDGGYVLIDDVKLYNIYQYPDYCPAPVKLESPDYNVIMSVCSLWREGTHYGWDFVSPWDECTPLMGYYDEGIPEEADWETKLMVEQGVDALEYCWYAPNGVNRIKTPRMSWACHDGYFFGEYSHMLDFMFMWENAGFKSVTGMTLETFKENIWDYWVEWYFRDSRYFTIDNKLVLHIYQPDYLTSSLGSEQAVKEVFDFMREDIKNYGYDGMIILSQKSFTSPDIVSSYKEMGYDGNCLYSISAASYDPEYIKSVNQSLLKNIENSGEDFFLVPTVATGRNIIGWENTRSPLADKQAHIEVLEYYKQLLADRQNDYDMIYLSTWNEFGEGHWLAPSGFNGFDYEEAWREQLCGDYTVKNDITPTLNQKNRICKLYNDTRTPIRAMLYVGPDYADYETQSVLRYDFNDEADIDKFLFSTTHIADQSIRDGYLYISPKTNDPMFYPKGNLNLNAEDIDLVHVRMKGATASNFTIYFNYEDNTSFSATRSLSANFDGMSGDFIDIYIETAEFPEWCNTVSRLRFDPASSKTDVVIDYIDFLKITKHPDIYEVFADGKELQIPYYYKEYTDGEYYVACEPSTGIFSANNFYHQWSRFTQELYLLSPTDVSFLFTVGSDKCIIDGQEVTLDKPFYTFDALPVIPLKFVLDRAGITYEETEQGINAIQRDYDYAEIVGARVDYRYDFNLVDDFEGWRLGGATGFVGNGHLTMLPTPATSTSTGYDQQIVKENMLFEAEKFNVITVSMKYQYYDNKVTPGPTAKATIYFNTTVDSKFNEAKGVNVIVSQAPVDENGYSILTFNMDSNENWAGIISSIRFDPTNYNGRFDINYVEFSKANE